MNGTVKKAYKMQENGYKRYLPELEIGEVCEMNDLWDGEGEPPEESYSYKIGDTDWINYVFEILEEKENPLDTVIKISAIDLI